MKSATQINEQIELLKSRGLIIDNPTKAQEQLLDIGYYRLGFYAYYWQNKKHFFKENTRFSDLIDLYYLDTDLKFLLLKYISRIEINFRTKLVYFASNQYNQNPTWFADSRIMEKNFIEKLPLFYTEKFKQSYKTIKKHHQKYRNDIYAPAWKTLEFFTFGNILSVYKSLKDKDLQTQIARNYKIKSFKTLINFLETIRFVRNISAHGGTFYDCNTPFEIKKTSVVPFFAKDKHAPYTCIKVILFMINQISENRGAEMKKEIQKLFNKYAENQKIKEIISQCIKYSFDN